MTTIGFASCFDASALLKLYVDERGSELLREYWNTHSTKFTTSICFYETLNLLKVCHFYRKTMSLEQYKSHTLNLAAWYGASSGKIPEPSFLSPEVFFAAQRTAEKHSLDLSDAFQIHSIKNGFFSVLAGESRTLLVSADAKLVAAARAEGVRAWSILDESPP